MKRLTLLLIFSFPIWLIAQNCIKGDCENGYGTCVYPSGAKYVGDFRNGKLQGEGILYFSDGRKYIGNWENQYRQGEGRMVFPNGDEYFGDFHHNQFHGEGAMVYASGNRYEGEWARGLPEGNGTFFYANGDRYEGLFVEGQCEGKGTLYFAEGGRYTGGWRNNRRHGDGVLITASGKRLEGEWQDGQYRADWERWAYEGDTAALPNCNRTLCYEGPGKFRYPDGRVYVGDFSGGRPAGIGTVHYPNGDRYVGQWKWDTPNGKGFRRSASGKVLGALWENGRPELKLFEEQRAESGQMAAREAGPVDRPRIWAVVVGAAQYRHMPTLRYTDDDAYQLYAFLKSPQGGAIPDPQLNLLIDEDATRSQVLNALRSASSKADDNDVLILYFSGHGLRGAFLPVDYDGYNNRLQHEEITKILASSRAKHKLVLADACHSGSLLAMKGGLDKQLKQYYQAFEDATSGMALLMSSKEEEYSLEDGGLRSGIFSHFLIKGLKGAANNNQDRIVTISELFQYVHQNVRRYTGNVQTPTLTGSFDQRMPVSVIR